jgi:hypothetical protein
LALSLPKRCFLLYAIALLPLSVLAQKDSASFFIPAKELNSKRLCPVVAAEAVIYTGGLIGLNSLWYKDYAHTPFHYFNDNREWLQVDKTGHAFSAYQLTSKITSLYSWTGMKSHSSLLLGSGSALLFLSTIEVLDGFSSGWGASRGDVLANISGCSLAALQEIAWKEQRIQLKFSYSSTGFAKYRPSLLGSNSMERIFKDYNGQTYWLSTNIYDFLSTESRFPKWLNLALGYGASGMIGGDANPLIDKNGNAYPLFPRYRQFYLSADIDLGKIKSRSPFLNTLLGTIGFLKLPFSALEYNSHSGFKFHPFLF